MKIRKNPQPPPLPHPGEGLRVGSRVHYRSFGTPKGEFAPECRAAIVTEVVSRGGTDDITPPRAHIAVLNPTGLFFQLNAPHTPNPTGGTWHHPDECPEGQ